MTRKRTNAPTRHFVIPEYQRGYSWTILECDKLWQDIEAFMASGEVNESGKKEPYFFGTIIADCSELRLRRTIIAGIVGRRWNLQS